MPRTFRPLDRRVVYVALLSVALGAAVAGIAWCLTALIGLVTHLAFYGRISTDFVSPAGHHLGAWVIVVPVIGGLIVGAMARWGSRAIRGHGIPEAMEQVLLNESKIPPRITWLKPVSSAIAIGTGGPFGAEGPIIATGGALGSLIGQLLHVTADERKTLLAAGAAAGMAAIFSAPVSAVLLSIELLLFERRARSLIPVGLAAATGATLRMLFEGTGPVFPMPDVAAPTLAAMLMYLLMGLLLGVVSVGITRLVYAIEDGFEKLPIHWMWWPALGGLAVGVVGYFAPRTLGVGYDNISAVISGQLGLAAMASLCVMKLISWSLALGSGTSGGTLAPLFTIGGALGGVLGLALSHAAPGLHVDPRVAALVCMAAMFAGSSRAFLTSVVFAMETTLQAHALLPLLAACVAAYLVSGLLMHNTIMTEKIARRGVRVPAEYTADFLEQVLVRDACSRNVVSLRDSLSIADARAWLRSGGDASRHQGFPVINDQGQAIGVVTRRQLTDEAVDPSARLVTLITRAPLVVREDHSLREAADHMVEADVGRLIVLGKSEPHAMVGFITRGDLLKAHSRRLREARDAHRHFRFR
ncbi:MULTISPECIES: chloride channel protein [Dyella]|uniref:CBS domain-containing protein n=2 Tax=Dyella TaxID=231454 RepID=A0A4R0Z617_9GAMM|nr:MULTISPECIES: chloride channel protein [Dyella]TBR40634.1 CBS domain-containing protein [Dyella terrae]TCI13900.1 CBS domain-containing protein [Dyella soli]